MFMKHKVHSAAFTDVETIHNLMKVFKYVYRCFLNSVLINHRKSDNRYNFGHDNRDVTCSYPSMSTAR